MKTRVPARLWARGYGLGVMVAVVGLLLCAGAAADELPLPPDVKKAPPTYDLVMGSQPIKAMGLRTKMTPEQARAFYERALAKQGWTVSEVPWLAEAVRQREHLQQEFKEKPKEMQEQWGEAAVPVLSEDNFQRLQMAARQQLYASRGSEHLLIGFSPSGEQTLMAISRWEGAEHPTGMTAPDQAATQPGEPGWPAASPCCSETGVPQILRKIPSSVPVYPNGRMITAGASPGEVTRSATTEAYLTADSADAVAEFYRERMAYNGWSESAGSMAGQPDLSRMLGPQAGQFRSKALMFRSDHGLCSIVATEHLGSGASGSTSPLALMLRQSEGAEAAANTRTVVTVNYIKSAMLGRKRAAGSPGAAGGTP